MSGLRPFCFPATNILGLRPFCFPATKMSGLRPFISIRNTNTSLKYKKPASNISDTGFLIKEIRIIRLWDNNDYVDYGGAYFHVIKNKHLNLIDQKIILHALMQNGDRKSVV